MCQLSLGYYLARKSNALAPKSTKGGFPLGIAVRLYALVQPRCLFTESMQKSATIKVVNVGAKPLRDIRGPVQQKLMQNSICTDLPMLVCQPLHKRALEQNNDISHGSNLFYTFGETQLFSLQGWCQESAICPQQMQLTQDGLVFPRKLAWKRACVGKNGTVHGAISHMVSGYSVSLMLWKLHCLD